MLQPGAVDVFELPPISVPPTWIRDTTSVRGRRWLRVIAWTVASAAFFVAVVAIVFRVIPMITGRPVRSIRVAGPGGRQRTN